MSKFVLTGPPGSGKTTLMRSPELNTQFSIYNEVARALMSRHPNLEGEELQMRIEALQKHDWDMSDKEVRHCIFDRGIPDQVAYRTYLGYEVPSELYDDCWEKRYDMVFYCPFWDDIYVNDPGRPEDKDSAKEIGVCIKITYQLMGYDVIVVPKGTPQQRVNFILSKINGNQTTNEGSVD